MNKTNLLVLLFVVTIFSSCHPGYKKLTRGNWEKDTAWVRYPDLPAPVLKTINSYFKAEITADTSDDLPSLISLDGALPATAVVFYNANSPGFHFVYGSCFKIGKSKYFMDLSETNSPRIYYEGNLYYPVGRAYFDPAVKAKMYSANERKPYDKEYYVRLKLKKNPKK